MINHFWIFFVVYFSILYICTFIIWDLIQKLNFLCIIWDYFCKFWLKCVWETLFFLKKKMLKKCTKLWQIHTLQRARQIIWLLTKSRPVSLITEVYSQHKRREIKLDITLNWREDHSSRQSARESVDIALYAEIPLPHDSTTACLKHFSFLNRPFTMSAVHMTTFSTSVFTAASSVLQQCFRIRSYDINRIVKDTSTRNRKET